MIHPVLGTGISAIEGKPDLSDFGVKLDEAQSTGVEAIELPTFDLDVVVGGRVNRHQLDVLKSLCHGRGVTYTVHGPLAINFFDEPYRLERHFEILKVSMEVAAELEAIHYVMHAGMMPVTQSKGLEAAYVRQRDYLHRAGDVAKSLGLYLCVENLFGEYHGKIHTPTPSRLAQELKAINHSHVCATLDISHAYLELDFRGLDLVTECAALAPFAKHLHIHDSFGRQDDIWMYTNGERLAFGHGDLHLPVGWGDIPWDRLIDTCVFPQGVLFNIELDRRYWHERKNCVDATKRLAARAKTKA